MGKSAAFICVAIIMIGLTGCVPVSAGPLENADEFMQSQINLQSGEETDAPTVAPAIEWADDSNSGGVSEDTGSGSNTADSGQSGH